MTSRRCSRDTSLINNDIVVAGNCILRTAHYVERTTAAKIDLPLAKEGTLLLIGLLRIGGAIRQGVRRTADHFNIERLAALVVDGGTVVIMDGDPCQLNAEFPLTINQQRAIAG